MDNLYLWIGLGITLTTVVTILLVVKTSKRRAREVEELNQHFPQTNENSVTVESMRGRLRRSQRIDAVLVTQGDEKTVQDQKQKEELVNSSNVESSESVKESGLEDSADDADKSGRYRRSIFHPDHLKKDQDDTKAE